MNTTFKESQMTIEEIRRNAPSGATHYLNGKYYRREGDRIRCFHVCGGCCYAYHGNNGCGENMQWSKYTTGKIDNKYKPL